MNERRRGVVLDRDGTLIDFVRDPELGSVVSAFHPDQIRIYPGVVAGLSVLQSAGYALAIATNQPGPAKGQVPERAIRATNEALVQRLAEAGVRIDAVEVCLHHPEGGPGGDPALQSACECRKPRPGMLLALAHRLALDPQSSWMIGDAAVDIGAARAAGFRAGLVFELGRCEMCPLRHGPDALRPDAAAARLDLLARLILQS